MSDKFDSWIEKHKHLQGQHNQKLHGNRGARISNAASGGQQAMEDALDTAGFQKAKGGMYQREIPASERDQLAYAGGVRKYERINPDPDNGVYYTERPSGMVDKFNSLDDAIRSLDHPGRMNHYSTNFPQFQVNFMATSGKLAIPNQIYGFVTKRAYQAFLKKHGLSEKKAEVRVRQEKEGLPTTLVNFSHATLDEAKAAS